MKRIITALLLGAMIIVSAAYSAPKKSGGQSKEPTVAQILQARKFRIDVTRMIPDKGRSTNLNSSWSLRISGDSVISNLPYVGEAWSVPYGGGEGACFMGMMTGYKLSEDKKSSLQIATFKVRTREDVYEFTIQVFPNSKTYLILKPTNKQPISYDGKLKPVEDK